jgi:hypothetical protein
LIHLSRTNPTHTQLQRFRKAVRAPEGMPEEPGYIDENNFIDFRLFTNKKITLSKGQVLLKKAAISLQEALPPLGHGGFDGVWSWLISRFEDPHFKKAPLFPDQPALAMAQIMGFDVKERRVSVQKIEKAMQGFFNDHNSIFAFLRPPLSQQIPREDMAANAVVLRALDGFYKELAGDANVEYLHATKRLQGWIEKKFFAYLLASGDWPVENIDFDDLQLTDARLESLPRDRFYQSLQQYFLSVSRKTLLLAYENGLYFRRSENTETILVVGLTHDFDDPLDYLKQQNSRQNYQVKQLRIITPRKYKGYIRRDTSADDKVKIISQSPMLFVAKLSLPSARPNAKNRQEK